MKTSAGPHGWVTYDSPKPPRVTDAEAFWADPPLALSERCRWWVRQISRGWMPNRRIRGEGWYFAAEFYGVYVWEYLKVLYPLIDAMEQVAEENQRVEDAALAQADADQALARALTNLRNTEIT